MSDEQTINIRPPLWLPIVAVLVGGCFYIAGKNIEVKHVDAPGTITVTGEGKASVTPDIAQASFGLDTGAQKTTAAATSKLSDAMNAIYTALQNAGVDKKDITTQSFSLNPVYNYQTGTQVIQGYQATESFMVKIRNMDKVSDVVTAATNAGANQAGNISFTVDNPDSVQADARAKAITDAKQKAQTLAQQLGVHLGAIKQFSEGGGIQPPMPYGIGGGGMMAMDSKAANIPVVSGDQDVTVSVSITYELN